MKSRRVNLKVIFGALALVAVGAFFAIGTEGPRVVGSRFMSALAKGDVNELTALSFMDGESAESVRKKWEFTTKTISPHYVFVWTATADQLNGDDVASVNLQVSRNADSPSTYPENFGLPLVKKNGKWLVDVRAIDRKMYPGLPR